MTKDQLEPYEELILSVKPKGFNNDPFGGSPLTGFWADDTA
jgi:hypothetical protein